MKDCLEQTRQTDRQTSSTSTYTITPRFTPSFTYSTNTMAPPAQLPLRQLGKNGPKIPAVGFGLMGISIGYGAIECVSPKTTCTLPH